QIAAGSGGLAHLRLEAPVVAVHGDRFILRAYSPPETIAGGVILDPFAIRHRARDLARAREILRLLQSEERAEKFTGFVRAAGDRGLRLADLAAATGWTNEVLDGVAAEARTQGAVIEAG